LFYSSNKEFFKSFNKAQIIEIKKAVLKVKVRIDYLLFLTLKTF